MSRAPCLSSAGWSFPTARARSSVLRVRIFREFLKEGTLRRCALQQQRRLDFYFNAPVSAQVRRDSGQVYCTCLSSVMSWRLLPIVAHLQLRDKPPNGPRDPNVPFVIAA